MKTFLYDLSSNIENDWFEVNLLIKKAKDYREIDTDFYNVLCRSITILNITHLELFTKSLLKAIVNDLNRNLSFSELPIAVKRTYCAKYIGKNLQKEDKSFENRITKLIEKFNDVNCKIEYEAFLVSKNKNPNPHIIKTVFENLGIKNMFFNLNKSDFEFIFASSNSEILKQIQIIIEYTNSMVENFPYSVDPTKYNINSKKANTTRLWEDFLDNINQKRHAIVHGNVSENNDDINSLEFIKNQIIVFQYASIQIASYYVCK